MQSSLNVLFLNALPNELSVYSPPLKTLFESKNVFSSHTVYAAVFPQVLLKQSARFSKVRYSVEFVLEIMLFCFQDIPDIKFASTSIRSLPELNVCPVTTILLLSAIDTIS